MANTKPKAGSVPPEAPPTVEKPQRERFIEAATEVGVTDEAFEKAVRKVVSKKL